jgi:hypothetical protein
VDFGFAQLGGPDWIVLADVVLEDGHGAHKLAELDLAVLAGTSPSIQRHRRVTPPPTTPTHVLGLEDFDDAVGQRARAARLLLLLLMKEEE